MNNIVYLDNNSTTPLDGRVFDEMLPLFKDDFFANPSSAHQMGRGVLKLVNKAFQQIASLINGLENNIVITSGATEAINLAMKGIALCPDNEKKHIITVKTEHKAVLNTAKYLESIGFIVTYLAVGSDGLIDLDELSTSIKDDTLLVAIMLVNNETGVIQQIDKISEIAHEKGTLFFCDGTQAVGKCSLDLQKENIDLLSFSAHKFYGPKGIGALYIKDSSIKKHNLQPLIHGGTGSQDIRSGTLNSPALIGFGKACEIAEREMDNDRRQIQLLRDQLENELLNYPGSFVNGNTKHRLYNTSNICFPNLDAGVFVAQNRSVAVSNGSACNSALEEPSHVLSAMGLSNTEAMNSIRFSLGRRNIGMNIPVISRKILKDMAKLNA